jgi:rhamnosyltransferase
LTIVLSTYNGAKFVAEQVNSIRSQTFTDWSLLIRDDGSADDTVAILTALAGQDRRITILRDDRGNLGPAGSFGVLLEQAGRTTTSYVALADQDDVWLPDKLERELDLLRQREDQSAQPVPRLVYSDMSVVREDLSIIHNSSLRFQRLRHVEYWPLGTLLIQNFVAGCTIVCNRALLEAALPVPASVVMHDWWLALCASALGQVLHLPALTMLYRQHGGNALGSQGWRSTMLQSLLRPHSWWVSSGMHLGRSIEQACQLGRRLEREIVRYPGARQSLEAVRGFCDAFDSGGAIRRVRTVRRLGIRPLAALPVPMRFYLRLALWSGRTGDSSA